MDKLNIDSPVPLWYQVKERILANIENGKYTHGGVLPTETKLCEEYNVSLITIRKAMDTLVNEGFLFKKQGKGTFLKSQKLERVLKSFYGISEDILRQGHKPSRLVLDFKIMKPRNNIIDKFKIKEDEGIYEIRTLTLSDNEPIILSIFYIPVKYMPNLKREMIYKKSLYNIFNDEYKINLAKETWSIEATVLDEYEAKQLRVDSNTPALLHESKSFSESDEIIMFAKGILRGDKCKFLITLDDAKSRDKSIVSSK